MSNQAADTTVEVRRQFKVPAERVYDAWLDPQKTRQFLFGAPGRTIKHATVDARVGGSFSILVVEKDGKEIDHIGYYRELVRPTRIVFDFVVPSFSEKKTPVFIDISGTPGGCLLTLRHEMLEPGFKEPVSKGWTGILEALQTTQFGR